MVFVVDATNRESACGFQYLKRCSPRKTQARRASTWLNGVFCLSLSAAAMTGIWVSSLAKKQAVLEKDAAGPSSLIQQLGSAEYVRFVEYYEQSRRAALLAEAEQAKRDAVNIREEAKTLNLLALYDHADSLLEQYQPGDKIKTTTLVDVLCVETMHGFDARVKQVEGRYQDGIVGPLAGCNAGRIQPGEAIGTAGEHSVSLRND